MTRKGSSASDHSRRSGAARGGCCVALCAVLLAVLLGGCTETWEEPTTGLRVEAVVVLGNRPPTDAQGGVMAETGRRVRRGVELFGRGHAPLMVMTGGPAPRGDVEAEVMRAFAVELGVPGDSIRIEGESRDTIENAHLTKRLISAGGGPGRRPRIILVTSPSHLRRARALFECAGFEVYPAATERAPGFFRRIGDAAHEAAAAVYYLFIDECARARGD
ncbi:MAG: YdcF family protein [Polyangiales bacterium]